MKTTITKFLILTIAFTFALSVNYIFAAWIGPTQAPPGGNTPTPIHVGTTAQVKDGGLSVDALSVFGGGYFQGNVGIGATNPTEKLHVSGNIKSDGRRFYLGNQYLYGDNSSALYWTGNNDIVTQMIFRDKQLTNYGRVYGFGNGQYFGLLDGDGNWGYLQKKDQFTQFRINNSPKMTIRSSGNVGIGTGSPTQKLDVGGYVRGSTGLCIGDDCRTSWPSGGGGGHGNGSNCPAGQASRGVDSNGNSEGCFTPPVSRFGGLYQHDGTAGQNCMKPNPQTGGCSCPSGFTAYMSGQTNTDGWDIFICQN
ncbi:MAG: hypothetical protein ACE5F2_02300 [Candidatus Paceibacteria bacterium]